MTVHVMQLKEDVGRLLASEYSGGLVTTPLTSFSSPQFTKVTAIVCLTEYSLHAVLNIKRLKFSPAQIWVLPSSHESP